MKPIFSKVLKRSRWSEAIGELEGLILNEHKVRWNHAYQSINIFLDSSLDR